MPIKGGYHNVLYVVEDHPLPNAIAVVVGMYGKRVWVVVVGVCGKRIQELYKIF